MAQKISASAHLFQNNSWRNRIYKFERSGGLEQMDENQFMKDMKRKNICNTGEIFLPWEDCA